MLTKMKPILNSADVIDSRDVIERIDWLENDENRTDEESYELKALRALASEAESSPDWKHGEGLIRATYFTEYAQQLADDLGLIKGDVHWPYDCIDWNRAARELQQDYFEVDFGGVAYFIRA